MGLKWIPKQHQDKDTDCNSTWLDDDTLVRCMWVLVSVSDHVKKGLWGCTGRQSLLQHGIRSITKPVSELCGGYSELLRGGTTGPALAVNIQNS